MEKKTNYLGPLAGLNVLDFGHYYAGPMAGMLLADQGANVIRIVKPGDPTSREKELPEQQHRLLNRNKKLLILDLMTPEGKSQALSLIERADVLIENFRPGVMKRLGLDYASLKDKNSGLVYLSLPGFASTDKERAPIQAWEGILAAASGMYVDVSYVRKILNFPPLYTSIPVNSIFGAVHGVVAIVAVLLAREESGSGTVIEVPLVDAGMTGFVWRFMISSIAGNHTSPFMEYRKPGLSEITRKWEENEKCWYTAEDDPLVQSGKLFDALQEFWDPLYRYYRCADGRLIKLACMASTLRTERLLRALGIFEQLSSEGFVNIAASLSSRNEATLDNNIADYPHMSVTRQRRLGDLIAQAFLTKTADEWEVLLGNILPFSKVRTRQEYLTLKPMLDAGILTTMDNGRSELTVPGRFVDVGNPHASIADHYDEPKRVTLDEATALFGNKAVTDGQRSAPRANLAKGDLLKGMKVLDLSTFVAGPMATYLLAQYGADVIKLNAPTYAGKPAPASFESGKRSVLADLKTAPGSDIFRGLAVWADVVVHNKIDPVAERLGVTCPQIQALNPDAVVSQVSAFGGTRPGPWDRRFGVDPIPQAVTGLMAHYGTPDHPHDFEGTMIADALTGFGLAYGSLLAIWQKRREGTARPVRTSILRGGNYFQFPYMIAENGASNWGEAHGQQALGQYWWQRLYECSDGWIYVGTREEDAPLLAQTVLGSIDIELAALEKTFKEHSCTHWNTVLGTASIPCHDVLGLDAICQRNPRRVDNEEADETAEGAGEVVYWEDSPGGAPIVLQATDSVRIGENHNWKRLKLAPLYGEHSWSILRELGCKDDEIEHLFELKVIA